MQKIEKKKIDSSKTIEKQAKNKTKGN